MILYHCNHCGTEKPWVKMHNMSRCKACYNAYHRSIRKKNGWREYMKEYQRTRRWMEGGTDWHLMGDDIEMDFYMMSVGGELKMVDKS